MKWSKIGDHTWRGDRPKARFGHGAAAVGSRLFLFGGTTGVSDNQLKALVEQEVRLQHGPLFSNVRTKSRGPFGHTSGGSLTGGIPQRREK